MPALITWQAGPSIYRPLHLWHAHARRRSSSICETWQHQTSWPSHARPAWQRQCGTPLGQGASLRPSLPPHRTNGPPRPRRASGPGAEGASQAAWGAGAELRCAALRCEKKLRLRLIFRRRRQSTSGPTSTSRTTSPMTAHQATTAFTGMMVIRGGEPEWGRGRQACVWHGPSGACMHGLGQSAAAAAPTARHGIAWDEA